jgi:hypothetical protein
VVVSWSTAPVSREGKALSRRRVAPRFLPRARKIDGSGDRAPASGGARTPGLVSGRRRRGRRPRCRWRPGRVRLGPGRSAAPGPRSTRERGGSGIISCNNNDGAAENTWRTRTEAGIDRHLVVHWNVIPHYLGNETWIRASRLGALHTIDTSDTRYIARAMVLLWGTPTTPVPPRA